MFFKCVMVQWVQIGQIIAQRGEKEVGKLSSYLTPLEGTALDYKNITLKNYRI